MFLIFSSFLALSTVKFDAVDFVPLGILDIICDPKEYLIFHNPSNFYGTSGSGKFLGNTQYNGLYFVDKKTVEIENQYYSWETLAFTDLVIDQKCESYYIYQNTDNFELDLTTFNYSTTSLTCFFFTGAMTYDIDIKLVDFDPSYSISINNTFFEDHNQTYSFSDLNQIELRIYTPQNNETIKGSAKITLKKNHSLKYSGNLVSGYVNYTQILRIEDSGGMPVGAIFGIVCGSLLAIGILAAIIKITCCPSNRRRNNNTTIASMQSIPDSNNMQQPLNPSNNDPNNQYWANNNNQSAYTNENSSTTNPYEMPSYPDQNNQENQETNQQPAPKHDASDPLLKDTPQVSPYTVP